MGSFTDGPPPAQKPGQFTVGPPPEAAGTPAAAAPDPHPYLHAAERLLGEAGSGLLGIGAGALKGAGQTVRTVGTPQQPQGAPLVLHAPGLPDYRVPPPRPSLAAGAISKVDLTPHGPAQNIGYGGEKIGEFFIPGGAEDAAAEKLLSLAPEAPAAARVALRAIPSALSSGGVTALQGGNPGYGALAGAGGSAASSALRKLAEGSAEGAAGILPKMRKFGRAPGRDILDFTNGIRPGTVANSAEDSIGSIHGQRAAMANAATGTIPRAPAENAAGGLADTLETEFHENPGPAREIHAQIGRFPEQMAAPEALNLSRAMSRHVDFGRMPGTGHPDSASAALAGRAANELQLEKLLGPEFGLLGNREGSLIAIKNAMLRRGLGPGVPQRLMDRGAARTGALASSILGAQAAGPVGAISAPVLQELASLPATRMLAARVLDKAAPVARRLIPAVTSAATQKNQ